MTHHDLDIPAAVASMSDPTLLERVQNQMETTFGTWKLLTAGDPVRPIEHAIVAGMMDSIGQLLQAEVRITSKAMENVLGKSTAALCWAAGRDPALGSWVTAGGQAVRDVAKGEVAHRYTGGIGSTPWCRSPTTCELRPGLDMADWQLLREMRGKLLRRIFVGMPGAS